MKPSWTKRQLIWRHNGFSGSASMMISQCRSVIAAKTTTDESKDIAQKIWKLACDLRLSLKERVGP